MVMLVSQLQQLVEVVSYSNQLLHAVRHDGGAGHYGLGRSAAAHYGLVHGKCYKRGKLPGRPLSRGSLQALMVCLYVTPVCTSVSGVVHSLPRVPAKQRFRSYGRSPLHCGRKLRGVESLPL